MAISDFPILSMLRTRLQWHQQHQGILVANVANADTPEFRPRDLAAPSFHQPVLAATAGAKLLRPRPGLGQ